MVLRTSIRHNMGDCFVCGRPAVPLSAAQRKSSLKAETFEDQLVVVYFFQKFFNVPLLEESSEGCDADEDVSTLGGLLKSLGNPVEWAKFCGTCCPMIRRAKGLHDQLLKIEMQLRELRSKVEAKLRFRHAADADVAEEALTSWARLYLRSRVNEIGIRTDAIIGSEFTDDVTKSIGENNPTNTADQNEEIVVKLEPIEIEPYEPDDIETPLSSMDDSILEDIKLETDDESTCTLNTIKVEDYVIVPLKKNAQRDRSKTRKSKAGRGKMKTRKPSGKKLTSKSEISTEDLLEHDNSPLVDQVDTSIRFKDDLEESEPEVGSSNDNSEDSDYAPEPEVGESKRHVRLPKKRKPSFKGQEKSRRVICNGPRRTIKYIEPESERTCPICKILVSRKSALMKHMNSKHLKQVVFTCDICHKGFYTRISYNRHCKKHLTVEEVKHLTLANKLDSVKVDGTLEDSCLEDDNEDGGDAKEYSEKIINKVLERTCPICKKVFTDKGSKDLHVDSVHEKNKPYVCDICGKAYYTQSYLVIHMKRHEITEREAKCNYPGCKSTFALERDMLRHKEVVHQRKFEKLCIHCGKKLCSSAALQRHIFTIHTEDAPANFKCQICPKEFLTKQRLTAHMQCRSHGGPGLKKRKWIPKHIRHQMRIAKGLIPPSSAPT